jgi:hypothetical protein
MLSTEIVETSYSKIFMLISLCVITAIIQLSTIKCITCKRALLLLPHKMKKTINTLAGVYSFKKWAVRL